MKSISLQKGWIVLCLTIFGIDAVSGATVRKTFEKTVGFERGGIVSVKNVNGTIEVESWNRNSIEVRADIEVKAKRRREAEEFLDRVEIIMDVHRGRATIEVDYPRRSGSDGFFGWLFGKKIQVKVDFQILVPERADLTLRSVNGAITVDGIEGEASFGTTNGSVEARDLQGSVDAHTTNGHIDIELVEVDPNVGMSFRSTNGGIEISLPHDIRADLEVSTTNGRVSTDFPVEISGRHNRKRIRGEINGGGRLIEVRTVNGSIQIREE